MTFLMFDWLGTITFVEKSRLAKIEINFECNDNVWEAQFQLDNKVIIYTFQTKDKAINFVKYVLASNSNIIDVNQIEKMYNGDEQIESI